VDRFADRFDVSRYADEEPFGIGLATQNIEDWLFVPQPLLGRVLAVARAYDLHYLGQVVSEQGVTEFNPTQCYGVLDELAFVRHVLNDPLVDAIVAEVESRVAACARSPNDGLIIDLSL